MKTSVSNKEPKANPSIRDMATMKKPRFQIVKLEERIAPACDYFLKIKG